MVRELRRASLLSACPESDHGEAKLPQAQAADVWRDVWDPGWDPLIGFLDRPSPKAKLAVEKTFGPVNRAKRHEDEEKLQELFAMCRTGNIREARTVVYHSPYLLQYTDEYGFTALHHAQLSKNGEFYAQLLELFNDPRCFVKKMVWYTSLEALRHDGLQLKRELDAERPDGGLVTVQQVTEGSLAAWSDVVAGDFLEGAFTEALCKQRLRKIMKDVVGIANGEMVRDAEAHFPVAFEFRGPACRDILAEGIAALAGNPKQAARKRRKQQAREEAAAGYSIVTRPGPKPETCWGPKKANKAHPHSTVLPTLLVREQKQAAQVWVHPLAPFHEAQAAASRAAARVAAVRSKSSGHYDVAREATGPPLRSSVSLPALAQNDMVEVVSPKVSSSPTWSRRHWLPENVQVAQVPPRTIIRLPRLAPRDSLAHEAKLDNIHHSLVF